MRYCPDLIPYGAFEGLEHGAAGFGYLRKCAPDTKPLACWGRVSSVDRGLVRFDLGSAGTTADRIVIATLEYDLVTTWDDPSVAGNCPDDIPCFDLDRERAVV